MQFWSSAVIHSIAMMQKNPSPSNAALTLAVTNHAHRHLQAFGPPQGFGGGGGGFGGPPQGFGGPPGMGDDKSMKELMDDLAKCHIDVQTVQVKAMGLLASGALPMEPDAAENMDPKSQVKLFNQIMSVFAPDDEKTCSADELNGVKTAFKNFGSCIGIEEIEAEIIARSSELLNMNLDICNDPSSMMDPQPCMDAIFGSPVGDFLRALYQHIGKYCDCEEHLNEALPSCGFRMADIAPMPAHNPMADTYGEMQVSGGAYKGLTCMIGQFCESLDGECGSEFDKLDKCLPQDGAEIECERTIIGCAESDLVAIPPPMSRGKLPDVCLEVYKKKKLTNKIPQRFHALNAKCAPEHTTSKQMVMVTHKESSAHGIPNSPVVQTSTSSFKPYQPPPEDELETTAEKAAAQPQKKKGGVSALGVFGAIILCGVIGGVVYKRYFQRPPVSRFQEVAIDDAYTKDLELS